MGRSIHPTTSCVTLKPDRLLGNVFKAAAPGPASAKIRYQIEGSDVQEVDWQDGQPAPEATSRISVFDSRSAALYVDEKNRIEFLPRTIDLVRQLGHLCMNIGEKIKNEISLLTPRLARDLPPYPQDTKVASIIDAIQTGTTAGRLPTVDDILAHATWTVADGSDLQQLEKDLASDPRVLAEQRKRCEASCQSLARELEAIEAVVDESALYNLQTRYAALIETRKAAQLAASQLSSEPLQHIGSDPWRRLFEYAKEYSRLAYPDVPPPATRGGDRCVLCQQLLSPEAADRLLRFEEFVSGKASQEAAAARRELDRAVQTLKGVTIPPTSSVEQRLAEYGETSPPRKATQQLAASYFTALARRRTEMLAAAETGDFDHIRSLSLPDRPPLADEASALAQEAASLRVAATDATERSNDIARRNELAARKQLSSELAVVLERRSDVDRWHKLKSCQAATSTQAISLKVTELRRSLITADLEQRIKAEIENLRLGHIPFKVRDASSKADSLVQIALDGTLAAVNSRVLSEGEQRALALACFLADVAGVPSNDGIIVDDPVSSLDHIRMRTVAKRLVEEAARRQVIIFTHNLAFFREVSDGAAEKQIPVVTHWVQRSAVKGFGVVSENDEPWFAKKVKTRLYTLKQKQTKLLDAKAKNDETYRAALKDLFSDLRETWERLVEELLLYGVVERLCTDVKTQKLKGVYVEDTDYQTIYWEMKRASELSGHDMTSSKSVVLPDLPDVAARILTLEQYIEDVNARRKEIEGRRKQLERAPEASLV